ncbi:MAG: leucine-rich repeat domain-containing protein [Flavobacteriales bacterium]|nr:leucine-rich repeat domain-containing protein [Flavobacteriales bacterium]
MSRSVLIIIISFFFLQVSAQFDVGKPLYTVNKAGNVLDKSLVQNVKFSDGFYKFMDKNGEAIFCRELYRFPNIEELFFKVYNGKLACLEYMTSNFAIKKLTLYANYAKSDTAFFPEGVNQFTKLKTLHIIGFYLTKQNLYEISKLKNLDTLILDEVTITDIPEEIARMINLKSLKIIDCQMKSFARLPELKSLKDLQISGSGLLKIPQEVTYLTGLESISLKSNKLTDIGVLTGLKRLQKIDVSGNLIKYLPSSLGMLKNLRGLNLSDNPGLNYDNIEKLDSLRTLDVSYNFLRLLPNNILQLGELRRLDLSFNSISSLHGMDSLYKMEHMNVSGNESKIGIPRTFSTFQNLKTLNFRYTELDMSSLNNLSSCEQLKMSILGDEIPSEIRSIPNLQTLSLLNIKSLELNSTNVGRLSRVKHLYIESFESLVITESIKTMSKLKSLEIASVRNLKGANTLFELPNLDRLYFNKVGKFEEEFKLPEESSIKEFKVSRLPKDIGIENIINYPDLEKVYLNQHQQNQLVSAIKNSELLEVKNKVILDWRM